MVDELSSEHDRMVRKFTEDGIGELPKRDDGPSPSDYSAVVDLPQMGGIEVPTIVTDASIEKHKGSPVLITDEDLARKSNDYHDRYIEEAKAERKLKRTGRIASWFLGRKR